MIVGGAGPRRTPRLAARYADEFNLRVRPVEDSARRFGRVRDAAAGPGGRGHDLVYSDAPGRLFGANDAEVARRAAAIGEVRG